MCSKILHFSNYFKKIYGFTGNFKPFTIQVVTDVNETPDIGNRGFFLNYRQQFTCT